MTTTRLTEVNQFAKHPSEWQSQDLNPKPQWLHLFLLLTHMWNKAQKAGKAVEKLTKLKDKSNKETFFMLYLKISFRNPKDYHKLNK